jgi:hypothetical protein
MRKALSIGSAGAPAVTAASARGAGVLASMGSASFVGGMRRSAATLVLPVNRTHGATARRLDRVLSSSGSAGDFWLVGRVHRLQPPHA